MYHTSYSRPYRQIQVPTARAPHVDLAISIMFDLSEYWIGMLVLNTLTAALFISGKPQTSTQRFALLDASRIQGKSTWGIKLTAVCEASQDLASER